MKPNENSAVKPVSKCIVVLTSGVTIEFMKGDKIMVNGNECDYDNVPELLSMAMTAILNDVVHERENLKVKYFIPSDKISWAYVQEVKDEPIQTKRKS